MSISTEKIKIETFEYVLFELVNWFMNKKNISNYDDFNQNNDLNKLKVIKLHFFVTAIDSNNNNLLEVFDKFFAMPYGHVESDIYNSLGKLNFFTVDVKKLIINDLKTFDEDCFINVEKEIKNQIKESIEKLKVTSPNIINYNALDLVELSHTWFSWKSMFSFAQSNNRNSEHIPSNIIKDEIKNFELVF